MLDGSVEELRYSIPRSMSNASGQHAHSAEEVQRRLDLLMRIDKIRDAAVEPGSMLGVLLGVVAAEVRAELALLYVLEPSSGVLELRAVEDHGHNLDRIDPGALAVLAEQTRGIDTVEIRSGADIDPMLSWSGGDPPELAIVPVVMGRDERLGTVLLFRCDEPFSADDEDILTFVESQLDSAVVQAVSIAQLDLRNRELETIYRVDRVRDERLPFDDMLNRVLEELGRVIEADMSFIMLYDRAGKNLEMRAVSPTDLARTLEGIRVAEETAHEAVLTADLIQKADRQGRVGSVMCVPLILQDEILGVFGMCSERSRGFREPERRLLSAIASQIDTAIFEGLEQRRLRRVLGRSVDLHVMERLLESSEVEFLAGERRVITVLYGDLRGSTGLAESSPPEKLVQFVNDFLSTMSDVILQQGATLDKFIGDQVLALFGAPFPMEDHPLRAVKVGLSMQYAHRRVVNRWKVRGFAPIPMGIGISTGELTVGEFGSDLRSDYTVIGAAANLGYHICGGAAPGEVLISAETYELIADHLEAEPVTGRRFKGVPNDLAVYRVTGAA